MIEPIKKTQKEWDDSYKNYGVTKFIGKDNDGYRGVIVELSADKTTAKVYVINGPKTGMIVEIKEDDPNNWASEV